MKAGNCKPIEPTLGGGDPKHEHELRTLTASDADHGSVETRAAPPPATLPRAATVAQLQQQHCLPLLPPYQGPSSLHPGADPRAHPDAIRRAETHEVAALLRAFLCQLPEPPLAAQASEAS